MKEKAVKQKKERDSNAVIFMSGAWWKRFGKGIMPTLSKLSKAFLLPIALLPIAGIFLGVGATITSNVDKGLAEGAAHSAGWLIGNVMNQMGNVAFGNLPVLFAISVAIAYTDDSGVAAITAVIGFLVVNAIQGALLSPGDGEGYKLLWWTDVNKMLITSNLGINSLNTGVFTAIFVGAIAAWCFNKFHKTQLPQMLSFFSGSKLVPIVAFVMVIPLSFVFMFIWPPIGTGLSWFGNNIGHLKYGGDSFLYEVIERSLVPFGLHHVFYAPLWWTEAGGSMGKAWEAIQKWLEAKNSAGEFINYAGGLSQFNIDYPQANELNPAFADFLTKNGDQFMMYAIIGNSQFGINFDMVYQATKEFGSSPLNLGRFQSGKFGFMLFALPAAAVAMLLNVPKGNRKNVMGIYFSAAFTCFLTGITEPIEFTFLFLAPWLFYGVHMPLAAISFFLTGLAQTHVTMTVSGGFLDYVVFGLVPFKQAATNPFWVLLIAVGMAPLYFFSFYFAVKYGKVMVPGRDGSSVGSLFKKQDYKDKKASESDGESTSKNSDKVEAQIQKATKIIEYLGGEENIKSVDSCASRLRLTVVDSSIIDKNAILGLGGATGALVKGENVQIVYGGEQEVIKPHMKEILAKQRAEKAKA